MLLLIIILVMCAVIMCTKRTYKKKKIFLHDSAHYGLNNLKLNVNPNRSRDVASDIVCYSTFRPETKSYDVSITRNPSDVPFIANPTYNYPISHREEDRSVQPIDHEFMECSDLDESVEMDSHPSHGGGFIGESRAKVFNTSDGRAHQSSTNATTKEDNNSVTNTTDDEGKMRK